MQLGGFLALDDVGVTQTERAERHVDGVTSHVAEGAGAKILPSAPFESVISVLFVGTQRRGSKPQVPTEAGGHRIFAGRAVDALRPDRAVAPDMQLLGFADDARLDDFDGAPEAIPGAALVAHLR